MANERYLLTLRSATGNRLADIRDFSRLDLALVVNAVGSLVVNVPSRYEDLLFDRNGLVVDNRIEVFRYAGGASRLLGDKIWFIRDGQRPSSGQVSSIQVMAECSTGLLNRRIVAYAAASAEATKSDQADDMMKAIVRENLGVSAGTGRNLSTYLSVQADMSHAGVVDKAFSRRIVLNVLQEIAQQQALGGTYLAFDIVRTGDSTMEFRVYEEQRGTDHRTTSQYPLLMGRQYGNIIEDQLEYLHGQEITFVYAGGQGEEAARLIATASDTTRIARSPFNRIERFVDGRMIETAGALADDAEAALREGRPGLVFRGRLQDTQSVQFGVNYNWGDYLTVAFRGDQFDCRLEAVHIRMDEGGEEIDAWLVAEDVA